MAAAVLGPVGSVASSATGKVEQAARKAWAGIEQDALGYLERTTRSVGMGMVVAGVAMGVVGWYLKAAATTAGNNELQVLQNIGSIYSNIKAPSFVPAPAGAAPINTGNALTDVQNFFADAWSDVQATGSDIAQIGGVMGTLGEDVADGLIDTAKAMLAFTMHFPDILWNGLVWGVGGAIADILNWAFPYLIVFGLILLAISVALGITKWLWNRVLKAGFDQALGKFQVRTEARSTRFWDGVFGNFKHPVTVPVAPEPAVPKAVAVDATPDVPMEALPEPSERPVGTPPEGTAEPTAPSGSPAPPGGETPSSAPETPPGVEPPPTSPPEAPPEAPAAPENAPGELPTTNGTTAQTQELLGGVTPPGWTQDDLNDYLSRAPPPEPAPEPVPEAAPSGIEIARRADELLS